MHVAELVVVDARDRRARAPARAARAAAPCGSAALGVALDDVERADAEAELTSRRYPRATEARSTSSGASIESSFAHTLVVTLTMSTPRSSAIGRARSAIRGPTAVRHSRERDRRLPAREAVLARALEEVLERFGASRVLRRRFLRRPGHCAADGSIAGHRDAHRAHGAQVRAFRRPPPDVRPGTVIADKYRIERELGRGGFGVVVRARAPRRSIRRSRSRSSPKARR